MKTLRVLIIDDSKEVLLMVEALLKQMGVIEITPVLSGEEAIKVLTSGSNKIFDLIICDQHMSGMTGIETLKIIRTHYDKNLLPFIMLTSDGTRENIIRLISSGGNSFIVKPPSLEMLKKKIVEVLEKSKA